MKTFMTFKVRDRPFLVEMLDDTKHHFEKLGKIVRDLIICGESLKVCYVYSAKILTYQREVQVQTMQRVQYFCLWKTSSMKLFILSME